MKYRILVHYWNPNGTNDIEIVDSNTGETVAALQDALFGVNTPNETQFVDLKTCLEHIAVSPVNSGIETVNFLKKYFKVPPGKKR